MCGGTPQTQKAGEKMTKSIYNSNPLGAKSPKILVCDDHQMMRDALRPILETGGFIVREATDFETTSRQLISMEPVDIVLLDVQMPGMAGLSSIKRIVEAGEHHVILMSGAVPPIIVKQAIDIGAKGYISKGSSLNLLLTTLKFVMNGGIFLPYDLHNEANKFAQQDDQGNGPILLTIREQKILFGVSIGKSNKKIAEELGYSEATIKVAMRNICDKLNARNRTQAVIKAKQMQIV